MRVAITVVSCRDHKPAFTRSLCQLLLHAALKGPSYGIESLVPNIASNCSNLPKARNDAIAEARKQGMTHVLFLDDDTEFPADLLQSLASHKVKAVGVNYPCKEMPLKFTCFDTDGDEIDSRNKTGLQKVGGIGFGMFLLNLAALNGIEGPYFEMHTDRTEDVHFCNILRKNGVDVYVDHDLSQRVGHVGDYTYTLNSCS